MDVTHKLKKKPTKIEEMTKEQIRQAILKKRECNSKAQHIVESLLEKDISENYLLQCLADINQSHFEDVIEERAIIHLCGYPVCNKTMLECDIPKQKYRISMRTNKVYDITGRKNFCSNSCYKAAMYLKKQLLTSPLWFREYEEIPKFHLLPLDPVGIMGEEVDVALVDIIKIKSEKNAFTSINDFATASLHDITDDSKEDDKNTENNDRLALTDSTEVEKVQNELELKFGNENVQEENLHENITNILEEKSLNNNKTKNDQSDLVKEDKVSEIKPLQKPNNNENHKPPLKNPLNIVGEIIEKPEKKIDPILANIPDQITSNTDTKQIKKPLQKKQPIINTLIIEVEKCLAEWFTLDTILLLFGEERVREMLADKGECIKEYLNNYSKGIFYNSNAYDQYQELCRKLNMLELEDRLFDTQTLQRETKPLPDYNMLQEESKKMQLKVKAFFAGETEISKVDVDETDKTTPPEEDTNLKQLPLVDKNSQNALRRRIVCQHLIKVLPDLLQSLGLLSLSISSDVRLLVNTFKLKANNIMFKPIQWTLIAIVVIKLLSLRDKRLEYLLERPTAYQHMQLLLLSYKQDGGYLDRLISWLTDIDRLLDTNDTQLTVNY